MDKDKSASQTQPSKDERAPIEEVMPGARLHPLEADLSMVEAFVLIKTKEQESDATDWIFRTTNALNRYELLGVLQVQMDLIRRELAEDWDID